MRGHAPKIIGIRLLLALLFCAVLSGCAPAEDPGAGSAAADPVFRVYLAEDAERYEIVGENPVLVRRGEEARFTLKMKGENRLLALIRQNESVQARITAGNGGEVTAVIPDIRYDMILSAECGTAGAYILYYPNGGSYREDDPMSGTAEPYTAGVILDSRLRPNTETGTDRLVRTGYVLTGWNTRADGSGEHTGLGSRVTVEKGGTLALYAEWEKESDTADFVFRKYGKGYTVTAYTGRAETVVLPSEYEGQPVDIITRGAFADAETVKTVILSPNVETVAAGAFSGCPLEKIVFFDSIRSISDAAFENCPCLSTAQINAVLAPRFVDDLFSEYNLADKYDLLILNRDRKKAVIFGGSGAYNSVDAMRLEKMLEEAGEDYLCLNLAVNGWFNGAAQIGMISHYLQEGDLFLHIPETSSGFSLLYNVTMTPGSLEFEYNRLRFYYCLESNYDLIALFDLRSVTDFFDGFQAYNEERADMPEKSYADRKTRIEWYGSVIERDLAYMDERGTLTLPKKAGSSRSAGEADLVVEYLTDEAANRRLNGCYDSLAGRGIRVFFACAAVNADTLEKRLADPESYEKASEDGVLYYGRPEGIALPDYPDLKTWADIYQKAAEEKLHARILLPLSESFYRDGDFFEPDYHLSDEAAPLFTDKLGEALIRELKGGDGR